MFLWDEEGHLVTNTHVVRRGTRFVATFLEPRKHAFNATLVGVDKCRDVAVLKLRDAPRTSQWHMIKALWQMLDNERSLWGAIWVVSLAHCWGCQRNRA